MHRGSNDNQMVHAEVLDVESKRWYKRLVPRSWWSRALVVLIVVAAAAIVWKFYLNDNKQPAKGQTTANTNTPSGTSLEQKAEYLAGEGKYQAAEQAYQQELTTSTNTPNKLAVSYQQSSLAVQNKQYTDAKKYADEAMQLDPNSPTPYVALAQLAQAQSNYSLAKQYWQDAINHVTPDMPGYNLIKADYQSDLDATP